MPDPDPKPSLPNDPHRTIAPHRTLDQLLGNRGVDLPQVPLLDDTVGVSNSGTQSLDATELLGDPAAPDDISSVMGGLDQPRYTTGRIIGQGGMGIVVDAKDVNIRRRVAMKVMLSPESATRQQLIRFIEEAQVTGQLEHPGVAPVHELALDANGSPYYTMKLVKGETLDAILSKLANDKEHQYPLSRLLNIFLKICETIAFSHSRGVIHRDLKPANVMVGEFGEVLVMDWGLAKVLGASDEGDEKASITAIESVRLDDESGFATLDGQVMGSPRYMAPEQARGAVKEMDARTDIYALGAMLYQILTLHPPVSGDTIGDIISKVESGQILEPRERLRSSIDSNGQRSYSHLPAHRIPEPLAAVAMKALATEKTQRYSDAGELQSEIESWQLGFATRAESASAWRQTLLFVRRNRTVAIATACVFAAMIAGLAATLNQRNAAVAAQGLAEANEERAEDEAEKAKSAQAAAEASALSEERAKREAMVTLSASFTNLGFVEADQGKYAEAQLWFAKAAELNENEELKAVHAMRARAFGREGIQPVHLFYGRNPRAEAKVGTEHQLAMDPSNRFLRYRLLFHGPDETQDPQQDQYVLLDLPNEREVEFAGKEKLLAVDFSPQGGEMAVAFADGIVHLLNVADLSVAHQLQVETKAEITVLQYNKDGSRLFIGGNPARVFDVSNRQLLPDTMLLPTAARRAAFTDDNHVICSTHVLNGIAYNQFTQTYLFPLGQDNAKPLEEGMREAVAATNLDSDEHRSLSVPNTNATIDRFRLDLRVPGEPPRKISPLPMDLGRACVSPDGSRIAFIGGREGLVGCYELALHSDWTLTNTTGEGLRPVWTRDSKWVAVVGRGTTEIAVHSQSGEQVGKSIRTNSPIQDAAFSPDNLLVLACGDVAAKSGELQFWDWQRGEQVGPPIVSKYVPQSILYHPTENWLAIAMPLSNRIFKMAAGDERKLADQRDIQLLTLVPTAESADFDRILFSGDGRWLVNRGKRTVWCVGYLNLATGKYDAMALGGGSTAVTISAAGDSLMVVCYGDPQTNCPWVFDMVKQEPVEKQPFPMINLHPEGHLSTDGKRALFYGEGSNLAIYHLEPEAKLACPIIRPLEQNGRIMAEFIHGTPYVVAATWLNNRSEVSIYDQLTGQRVGPQHTLKMDVTSPVWVSPDGRTMAVRSGKTSDMHFVDLSYLHEDPRRGMSEVAYVEYAKVQACAEFDEARLISADAEEIWRRLQRGQTPDFDSQ